MYSAPNTSFLESGFTYSTTSYPFSMLLEAILFIAMHYLSLMKYLREAPPIFLTTILPVPITEIRQICSGPESLPTSTDQDDDEVGHALDNDHEQVHSEGLDRAQEKSVMEGANWSEQVLIIGKSLVSSTGDEILPESNTFSVMSKKICLKREPNDSEKIMVSGKDDLDHEVTLFNSIDTLE